MELKTIGEIISELKKCNDHKELLMKMKMVSLKCQKIKRINFGTYDGTEIYQICDIYKHEKIEDCYLMLITDTGSFGSMETKSVTACLFDSLPALATMGDDIVFPLPRFTTQGSIYSIKKTAPIQR